MLSGLPPFRRGGSAGSIGLPSSSGSTTTSYTSPLLSGVGPGQYTSPPLSAGRAAPTMPPGLFPRAHTSPQLQPGASLHGYGGGGGSARNVPPLSLTHPVLPGGAGRGGSSALLSPQTRSVSERRIGGLVIGGEPSGIRRSTSLPVSGGGSSGGGAGGDGGSGEASDGGGASGASASGSSFFGPSSFFGGVDASTLGSLEGDDGQ